MAKAILLPHRQFCIVDDEDFDWLSQFKWHLNSDGYVQTNKKIVTGKYKLVKMHREIMRAGPEDQVDHRNGNRRDNRKDNLRICTAKDNARNAKRRSDNSSGYKGVCFSDGRWVAHIQVNGVGIRLGSFLSKEEAAEAYRKAAIEFHGEFASNGERSQEDLSYLLDGINVDAERPSKKSSYRGVYWSEKCSNWKVSIRINGKTVHIGSFYSEEEAARAFDREALKHRGNLAKLNFPCEAVIQ